MRTNVGRWSAACALAAGTLVASSASASTALDSPDSGAVQMGRGGAWFVRADDPLAVFFNPAALVRQAYGVHVGAHAMFGRKCFSRLGQDGQPASPGPGVPGPGTPPGPLVGTPPPAQICENEGVFFNPQIAANFRVHDRFAVGIAVLGPHGTGRHEWPETIKYTNRFGAEVEQPAPQRFMLVSSSSTILLPTLSVAFKPIEQLAIGFGFISGVAIAEFVNFSEALSPTPSPGQVPGDDFANHGEVRSRLRAVDPFVPGFVASVLWSPTRNVDVSAWFKWLDDVDTRGDLYLESLYWGTNGAKSPAPCPANQPNCNITDRPDAGQVKLHLPLEAKVGVRYRHPLAHPKRLPGWAKNRNRKVVDSMSQDLFDIELNFTYANNSAGDVCESVPVNGVCNGRKGAGIVLRFDEGIPVNGTPGQVPTNADVPHMWKDVVGIRIGGDYNVLPGLLSLRMGGWYETAAGTPEWLNVDFHAAEKGGIAGGATVRLGPVDLSVGYQHTFFAPLDNKGQGKLKGLSGDAVSGYRTQQIVNGGKLESEINEVVLGGTLRW